MRSNRGLLVLFLVNLALQAFDGFATYAGLRVGFGEGNPLLAQGMAALGPVPTLVLAKLFACAALTWLWTARNSRLAAPGFVLTAVVYAACSFAPWSAALAHAHLIQS